MKEKAPKTKKNKTTAVVTLSVLLGLFTILLGIAVWIWNLKKPDPMSGQVPNFDISIEESQEEDETADSNGPTVNPDIMDETLPTVEEIQVPKDEGWTHYLLLGIDTTSYQSGRSDAMIVFSIHKEQKRLVLSSIPRDTLVYVEGKGFDKLTHAYQYGGANLTVKVFADNFDIDIANYFIVNFQSLPQIVDQLGGVILTLTDAEAKHMGDMYGAWGLSGGTQRLNGKEVLAYCRVRKIDSDYKRTERQYKALMAIYDQVKTLSYDKYIGLAKTAYDSMYSDMKMGDMLLLVKDVMEIADQSTIENVKIVDGSNSNTARLVVAGDGVTRSYVVVDDLLQVASTWREKLGVTSYQASARISQIAAQLKKVVGR